MKMLLPLVLALAPQFAAAATLDGDAVTLTFDPINFVRTETVGAGIDIEQLNFLFDFNAGAGDGFTWDSLPLAGNLAGSTGITLSSLDFSGGEILAGFTLIATSLHDLTYSFTDHSLSFFWSDDPSDTVGPGMVLSGTFLTRTAAVPLPAGLPLLMAGIGAIAALGRRRKTAA